MERIELAIQCHTDIAEELATELSKATRDQVDQAELNNLDGTTTVLQVVQLAVSLVAAVAPIVAAHITSNKVKKVKLGPIEIENPTHEQWEHLWKEYLSSKSPGGPGGGM
jgi:TRAP-type uncharacterized transport system substrate-binding protein